ncbi:MAG: hypothetical protein OXC97_05460 [Candidatus Dadabacteria bacterium]|nr:hypothetical protein [Candidatus Dadabacteria bacterium]
MLNIASKRFFLILLVVFFSEVPDSTATDFVPVYIDNPRTGFYDQTPLTDQVARGDNNGRALGDVRRIAFQNALNLLEMLIITKNAGGIRIQASFEDQGPGILASALPAMGVAVPSSLAPGGFITMAVAHAEHVLERELNGNRPDFEITFNERVPFYYGTGITPRGYVDFTDTIAHELIHGLGFLHLIREDGSFPQIQEIQEIRDIIPGQEGATLPATLPAISLYDLGLYSEREADLLINLSQSERRDAITSGDGLLWDGTLGGVFTPSCAQLMGEVLVDVYPSAVGSEGKPKLYAPNPYESGSSVAHFVQASIDIMAPFDHQEIPHAYFTTGVMLDMLWIAGNLDSTSQEILEDCLVDSGEETEPELESTPEPTPAPDIPSQSSGGGSGGGCSIAETQTMSQNTVLNLLLILLAMAPCLRLYRTS